MKPSILTLVTLALVAATGACTGDAPGKSSHERGRELMTSAALDTATFGAGCFWCVEAVFQQIEGVIDVVSGYTGGSVPNPTYEQVCSGTTGHAEATRVTYDPAKVSYDQLLEIFWTSHDPTTLNRQGADVGTQYRSVIFTHNDEQRRLAEAYRTKLDTSGAFDAPIVTEIVPAKGFYQAEAYHQNYFDENPTKAYCMFVIAPKVEKIRKVFRDRLKPELKHD